MSTVLPGGPGVTILTPDLRPPGEEALRVRQLVPARHARRARTRPRPRPAARPQQVAAAATALLINFTFAVNYSTTVLDT